MPEAGPEIPRVEELFGEEAEHHQQEGYGKFVAVAIVVTTLIGALVAFAQGGSLQLHDKADSRAERYGTLALEAAAASRGSAEVQIDRLNLATQEVRQANSASLFQQYGTASKATSLTAARWSSVAAQTEADSAAIAQSQGIPSICSPSIDPHCSAAGVSASYSPEQDPRFPTRYLQQGQRDAYRLTALRDSSNQAADDAEAQFVHYAAALTMLAVAVFLFGYSLTPQGRGRRRLYGRVAGGLVMISGVWALVQVLSPVSTPAPSAANAFADGEVALNDGQYPAAIADFNHTLSASPRFVAAYYDRGQAEFGAGFPTATTGADALPSTAGPVTIPQTASLDAAIRDDERARDEGSNSATLLLDLGRNLLYRGVIARSADDLRTSRADLAESLAQFRAQDNVSQLLATASLRIAEDDLALGDPRFRTEFLRAESALQAHDVPREQAVAGALTDLSLIEAGNPKLAKQVGTIRQAIVSAGAAGATTPTGKPGGANQMVRLSGISVQPDAGHALYTVDKVGSFDPTRDVLSAQWEYRDPLHGEWAVLPELSGPVKPGGLQQNGSGIASNNASYVSSSAPATCLPPGRYRVELYVNGMLAGSATGRGTWAPLHAVRLSGVDGAMCVPQAWKAFPAGTGADGFVSPDGKAGTVILSIPKATSPQIAGDQKALAGVMEATVRGFGSSILPGLKSNGSAQATPFFMSSDNGQYESWTDTSGGVLSGVGTSSNGDIYIGIAWSPKDATLAQQLFLSLSPL